jgi:hypothetical protein
MINKIPTMEHFQPPSFERVSLDQSMCLSNLCLVISVGLGKTKAWELFSSNRFALPSFGTARKES